jgi:hypothetical protein
MMTVPDAEAIYDAGKEAVVGEWLRMDAHIHSLYISFLYISFL